MTPVALPMCRRCVLIIGRSAESVNVPGQGKRKTQPGQAGEPEKRVSEPQPSEPRTVSMSPFPAASEADQG